MSYGDFLCRLQNEKTAVANISRMRAAVARWKPEGWVFDPRPLSELL